MRHEMSQNMTGLDGWLRQATHHLAHDSAAQVRTEIQQHYESAREDAIAAGATPAEADRSALTALGDAKTANRQYRRVLLTRSEARLLRSSNREAQFFCAAHGRKRLLFAIPALAALCAAPAYAIATLTEPFASTVHATASLVARVSAGAAILTGIMFAVPLLPIYTPARSRIYRAAKWLTMLAVLVILFDRDHRDSSWLVFNCLWIVAWIEFTRTSIRRKIPVANWPKQLYL